MQKRNEPAAGSPAWLRVDRSMACGNCIFEGTLKITDGERYVVHPLAARSQKPRHRTIRSDGLQQFDPDTPGLKKRDPHLLAW